MAEKKSRMTGPEMQTAREMLDDPFWRQRPRDERDSLSVRIDIDGDYVGTVTLGAGWTTDRRDIGWTRILELRLRPFTDDGFIDGSEEADIEPIIERASAHARRELRTHEATRTFICDLTDDLDPDLLTIINDPNDKPRESEIRAVVARVYELVIAQGRRDPIQWIAAVLGISERTAHRRLDEAERAGLINRKTSKGAKK